MKPAKYGTTRPTMIVLRRYADVREAAAGVRLVLVSNSHGCLSTPPLSPKEKHLLCILSRRIAVMVCDAD